MTDYMGQDVHNHIEMFADFVGDWGFCLSLDRVPGAGWLVAVWRLDDEQRRETIAEGEHETIREAFLNCRVSFEKYRHANLEQGDD